MGAKLFVPGEFVSVVLYYYFAVGFFGFWAWDESSIVAAAEYP